MDGIGIGGGGGARLGDGGGCKTGSVCVEIDIISTRSFTAGGGGARVGEIGVLGGLKGSSRVCDAAETIGLVGSMIKGGFACTRFLR